MNVMLLIAQILVIILVARLLGVAFRAIRQPQVMGEMVAGILLGPSLLGWAAPSVSATLFAPSSLGTLGALSQIGLILYMFLVGLELNSRTLRKQGRAAVVTSNVSIVVPFLLGTLLALYLYPRLSDQSVRFSGFALFMGAAMSVTAFPVLARILTERNLVRTRVGTVTIACAAVDDVTAWCILAGINLFVLSSGEHAELWVTIGGTLLFVLVMVFGVRRLLHRLQAAVEKRGEFTHNTIAVVILVVLASAWCTEWLGIHAVFGAFLAGGIMPRDEAFVDGLLKRFEALSVVLLLPLFFAVTGLRTSIALVSGAEGWFFCALIILVAVAGKFGGSMLAARFTGLAWREAAALGVLMNTRGLMELIILNVGLDLGLITPTLFTMMVMMALVTTFMTSPLLDVIYPRRLAQVETPSDAEAVSLGTR
jgi:Kef-type K+ transport system membrane component KefB